MDFTSPCLRVQFFEGTATKQERAFQADSDSGGALPFRRMFLVMASPVRLTVLLD